MTRLAGTGTGSCTSYGEDGGPATSSAVCYPYGLFVDATHNLFIADNVFDRVREIYSAALPPSAQAVAPTFSLASGTYPTLQTVTISDSTPERQSTVSIDGSRLLQQSRTATVFPSTLREPSQSRPWQPPRDTLPARRCPLRIQLLPLSRSYPPLPVTEPLGSLQSRPCRDWALVVLRRMSYLRTLREWRSTRQETSSSRIIQIILSGSSRQARARPPYLPALVPPGPVSSGVLATNARLYYPMDLVVDSVGNLYIADTGNSAVRKVNAATGIITTVAGSGVAYGINPGDGGPRPRLRFIRMPWPWMGRTTSILRTELTTKSAKYRR